MRTCRHVCLGSLVKVRVCFSGATSLLFLCEFWQLSSSNSVWSSSLVTNAFICRPTSPACFFFTSFYLMLHFIFNQYAVEDEDNLDLTLVGKAQFSLRLNLLKLRNFFDLGHGLSSKENKLSFCLGSR